MIRSPIEETSTEVPMSRFFNAFSSLPPREQGFEVFVCLEPVFLDKLQFFIWVIFPHAFYFCVALCVHVAFDFYPIVGAVIAEHLEVWEIASGPSLDGVKPKDFGLMKPVFYFSLASQKLQVPSVIGFPSATEVDASVTNVSIALFKLPSLLPIFEKLLKFFGG